MTTARFLSAKLLADIERNGKYSNISLSSALKAAELSKLDSAFVSSLIYGVLQRKITLDYIIERVSGRPVKKLHPFVTAVLRTGIYQIVFMDKVPASAAVNESVNIIKHSKQSFAAGFVNAILRKAAAGRSEILADVSNLSDLSVKYSCTDGLIKNLVSDYGKDAAEAFLRESLLPPKTYGCVNTYRADKDRLADALGNRGISCETDLIDGAFGISGMGNVEKLREFADGLFFIQDLSSQTALSALKIRPGMRVLDVCAAPGGKSFNAAQYLKRSGLVVSCDVSSPRVGLIKSGAERLGLDNITATVNDASVFRPDLGQFDRIICDVPCSGYGVIRRKPEIRYKDPEDFGSLPELQLRILEVSSEYLAPDGRLMYSTCTLRRAENEAVTEEFLKRRGGFKIAEQRTLMPQTDNCDGFYYCILKKVKSG